MIDILQWTGTKDPSAIEFMQEYDRDDVRYQCHVLLPQAIERVCEFVDSPPPYPLNSDFYGQMGTALLPPSNLSLLKSRLYGEDKIEVPPIQWQERCFIRISIQVYNTQQDVDVVLEALKVLLPQVHLNRL